MKSVLIKLGYALLSYFLIIVLLQYFEFKPNWWSHSILILFSLYNGSFFYKYLHGNRVKKLMHDPSYDDSHIFFVTFKIVAYGELKLKGNYTRPQKFRDEELRSKLFSKFNSNPQDKLIYIFASNKGEEILKITIQDNAMGYNGSTEIELTKNLHSFRGTIW